MDPKACLLAMFDAEHNDNDAYLEYRGDLTNWLNRGGFGPRVELADGKQGEMIKLTWVGGVTIRFGNGRRRVCFLRDVVEVL
jgi:hypothetical protein